MKNSFTFVFVAMLLCTVSCDNKQKQEDKQDDNQNTVDSTSTCIDSTSSVKPEADSSKVEEEIEDKAKSETLDEKHILFTQRMKGGHYRKYYIVRDDDGPMYLWYQDSHKKKAVAPFKRDNDDGDVDMAGFVSPNKNYVYAVGYRAASLSGWTIEYCVYQINTQTLKARIITRTPAFRLEKNGFTIPDLIRHIDKGHATQDIYYFRDVTYGFDGKIKKRGKVYHGSFDYVTGMIERKYKVRCNLEGMRTKYLGCYNEGEQQ